MERGQRYGIEHNRHAGLRGPRGPLTADSCECSHECLTADKGVPRGK